MNVIPKCTNYLDTVVNTTNSALPQLFMYSQRGEGIKQKKLSMAGVWIISGTTHSKKVLLMAKSRLLF